MLQIRNLFRVLPEFNVLQILNLFLRNDEFILTLLIGCGKFFLKVFHLLYKQFLIFQPLLQDHVFLLLSLEIELQQNLVLLV